MCIAETQAITAHMKEVITHFLIQRSAIMGYTNAAIKIAGQVLMMLNQKSRAKIQDKQVEPDN